MLYVRSTGGTVLSTSRPGVQRIILGVHGVPRGEKADVEVCG